MQTILIKISFSNFSFNFSRFFPSIFSLSDKNELTFSYQSTLCEIRAWDHLYHSLHLNEFYILFQNRKYRKSHIYNNHSTIYREKHYSTFEFKIHWKLERNPFFAWSLTSLTFFFFLYFEFHIKWLGISGLWKDLPRKCFMHNNFHGTIHIHGFHRMILVLDGFLSLSLPFWFRLFSIFQQKKKSVHTKFCFTHEKWDKNNAPILGYEIHCTQRKAI